METQLRCEGNLYGILSEDHTSIEVKCHQRRCGYRKGIVVLHTILLETGKVIETKRFRDASYKRKE
jgi:hypothetical protein